MSHGMNTTPMNESCTVDVDVIGFRAARYSGAELYQADVANFGEVCSE